MEDALLLDDVSKRYSGHLAVDRLSLAVPVGTIYGILGPNGAGKSTTLRMVMNIIARDSGAVRLLGVDPAHDRRVLRRVGYLPEERGLYRKMRVLDVIVFFARLKGVAGADARREGERWLERLGLAEWGAARVETLSKGMQQKVQFITTVLHEPELLILDEPTSGLDPVNQEVLQETIRGAHRAGRTVLFSTHNMDQAEQLCEQVCIIANGRKVLDGNLREIRRGARGRRYAIEFADGAREGAAEFMAGNPRFASVHATADGWEAELADDTDPRELVAALNRLPAALARFEHLEPSLHRIFVERVGHAEHADRRPEPAGV